MKNRTVIIMITVIVLLVATPIAAGLCLRTAGKAPAPEDTKVEQHEDAAVPESGLLPAPEHGSEKTPESEPVPEPEPEPDPVPLPKYDSLLEINPYTSGWLEIAGTNIDAPVVYTPGSQNYFLHRALDGSDSERGTFFIAVDWEKGYNNTLIYGHNMKDGSGFGSLAKFADKGYGLDHSSIMFDTLYEDREYELLAAFYSQIDEEELETEEDRAERDRVVAQKSIEKKEAEAQSHAKAGGEPQEEPEVPVTEEELTVADLDLTRDFGGADIYRQEKDEDNGRFRYYYYTDLRDKDDFDYYVKNVKERALYDTGEDAQYGDDLLTLSTCSYHVKNGRFIVVAVRHNN